jgi:hypothetical protein
MGNDHERSARRRRANRNSPAHAPKARWDRSDWDGGAVWGEALPGSVAEGDRDAVAGGDRAHGDRGDGHADSERG